MVATLTGALPILLLPVRIETRFFKNGTELRIRIYPDQVHLNAHEPELTESEHRAGKWYWEQRWSNAVNDVTASAWRALVKSYGPWRAGWIVRVMTPSNVSVLGTSVAPQFPPVTLKRMPDSRDSGDSIA